MANLTDNKQQLEQMTTDTDLLRYLIIDSKNVKSTVTDDKWGCRYIYVKPGFYDKILGVSNIDFVQEIYAQNGINLKKHISHLDNNETEVLFIAASDILKLTDMQQNFLYGTAPDVGFDRRSRARSSQVINTIFDRNRKLELQNQKIR